MLTEDTISTNSLKLVLNIKVVYINKSYPLPMTTEMNSEAHNSHQGASIGTFINTSKSQKSSDAIRTITSSKAALSNKIVKPPKTITTKISQVIISEFW